MAARGGFEKLTCLHEKLYTVLRVCQGVPHERSLKKKVRADFILSSGNLMAKSGQDHHIITDLPSADEVWNSLLGDLMETPLEIPRSWTDETSAKWEADGNCLAVAAPPVETAGWVEKRFLPLARIYLEQQQPGKSLVIIQKGGPEKTDLLLRVQRSVYDQVVEPQKLVPVPIYMFQHWLSVLGASAFWVAVAMRQVSFVSREDDVCVVKPISTRTLAKWAPLEYRQIARWLNKEGFSSWFYKKEKEGYEDVAPEYLVWSQVPVSPHHLAWIEDYFKQYVDEGSAADVIESLLDNTGEIRRVKPGDVDLPSSYNKRRRTILDLVSQYFPGNLSRGVSDLVIQLEQQITRPNLTFSIPHYFFHKFMGVLNSNEVALIWYLRSLYKEDDSNSVQFSGYGEISAVLGCGNRTPKRLLEKCIYSKDETIASTWDPHYRSDLSLGNWLKVEYLNDFEKGVAREFSIKIRPTEPVHQDDKGYYNRLIKKQLDDMEADIESSYIPTQNDTGGAQKGTGSKPPPPHYDTGVAQNDPGDAHKDTAPNQKGTGVPRNKTHLNNSNTNESLTDSFNDSLIPPQLYSADDELSTDSNVVGVREIDLEKLLGFGSYKHNEKKNLIKVIDKNQDNFLAWIIRNHVTAAKFPVRLAVNNVQEGNETENQYIELARLGWGITAQLARISENVMGMWEVGVIDGNEDKEGLFNIFNGLSKPAKKEIIKLRETGFPEIYEDIKIGVVNVL